MAKELNENTSFKVSIQTLIAIGFGMATIIGMWFALQADISEAKELPAPDITRMEFDMKDQNVRQTILTTQEDGSDNKMSVDLTGDKNYVFVGQRTGTSLSSTEAILDASFTTDGSEITIIQQDTGE